MSRRCCQKLCDWCGSVCEQCQGFCFCCKRFCKKITDIFLAAFKNAGFRLALVMGGGSAAVWCLYTDHAYLAALLILVTGLVAGEMLSEMCRTLERKWKIFLESIFGFALIIVTIIWW